MARPLRIEYPGAFYHITARGNEQKDIFRNNKDRERFLGYLEKAAIYLSHRYSGRPLKEIGKEFGIGESAVSQAGSRFESDMKASPLLRSRIEGTRKATCL